MSVEQVRHIETVADLARADLRRFQSLVQGHIPRGGENLHPVDRAAENLEFIKGLFTEHVSDYFQRSGREVRFDRKALGIIPPVTFIWPFGGDRVVIDHTGNLLVQVSADPLVGGPFFGHWVKVNEKFLRHSWDTWSSMEFVGKKFVRHIARLKHEEIVNKLLGKIR